MDANVRAAAAETLRLCREAGHDVSPAVAALHEPGDSARFNLGQERFAFDLEALALARQRSRAAAAAAAATAAHAMDVAGPTEMQ